MQGPGDAGRTIGVEGEEMNGLSVSKTMGTSMEDMCF